MDDSQPDTYDEPPPSAIFSPPSIHCNDLISGASYAHYTDVPCYVTKSIVPDGLNNSKSGTECVLGIDEAGRGPVIGPMVYGAFYLPIPLHHSLLASTYHFDDSKVLTPAVRAKLMKDVCSEGTDLYRSCGWAIKSLSAKDIGAGMLKNGGSYNLNAQAMDATIEIIQGVIDQGVNVREIYVDTIGIPAVYQKKLERIFPTIKITVEKKADSIFPCVSAASVVAKVTRDVSCEILYNDFAVQAGREEAAEISAAWGSGYPSDARCVNWLQREMDPVFGWGNECRFSWGTLKDMMEQKGKSATKVDWRTADQDDEDACLSDYFKAAGSDGKAINEADQMKSWFGTSVGLTF